MTPDAIAKIRANALRRAAASLDVSHADMLLAAGEMTREELRTATAILKWRAGAILAMIPIPEKAGE